MPTLARYGIRKRDVQLALDAFKQGTILDGAKFSKSVYLVDPKDYALWDLKATLVFAGQLATPPSTLMAKVFVSHYFDRDLSSMGFPILRFDEERKRSLGLRGFDPEKLKDPHVLFEPFTGEVTKNALSSFEQGPTTQAAVERRAALGRRFVRNSQFVMEVLRKANGMCAGCERGSFKTPAGNMFLEVHHKQWLREGGPDHTNNMVALCPNCHRQEHHGVERRFH